MAIWKRVTRTLPLVTLLFLPLLAEVAFGVPQSAPGPERHQPTATSSPPSRSAAKAALTIDGDPFDWTSDDLIAADSTGETSATAVDLLSLCAREQDGALYLRLDFKNQWVPLDAGWTASLFTYLSEVNARVLISFEGTNSTYKSLPGVGTEGVNAWHPWLDATNSPTDQGWDYAVVLDFKRDQVAVLSTQGASSTPTSTPMPASDYATDPLQGMVEFRFNLTFSHRGKAFHAIAYTIDESTNPWTPADACPNWLGGSTTDYDDDGDFDAYATSTDKVAPAKLAVVWHANQALGRNQIEGLSIVDALIDGKPTGFSQVLHTHLGYKAPVNLHWSGTLLTGMQWYTPDFVRVIRSAIDAGVVEVMTSTFGQSIMPWLPEDFNVYAINAETSLIERLFGVRPTIGWVPERCWKQFIFDDLQAAGIEAVVLDPAEVGSYLGYSPPEDVLYATPTAEYLATNGSGRLPGGADDPGGFPADAEPGQLKVFIVNNDVQGIFWDACVSRNYQRVVDLKSKLAYYASLNNPSKILVAASDMEIPGGHPYGYSWDGDIATRYDLVVRLLAGAPYVELEKLSDQLDLPVYDVVAPGFENAGVPDHFSSYGQPQDYWYYSRWATETPNRTSSVFRDSSTMVATTDYPQVPPPIFSRADDRTYEQIFTEARAAIADVASRASPGDRAAWRLLELANLTLLVTTYETAWCDNYEDPVNGTGDWLASWGRTIWAHAHHAQTLAAAANWSLNPPDECRAFPLDVDGDSYDEFVVQTPLHFAVIESEGGRVTFLANVNGSLLLGSPLANPQVMGKGGGSSAAVEDYFNPLTLDDEAILDYYRNYDVTAGLVDFFVEGASGGYPVNNGTGGFFYATPYSFPASASGATVEIPLVSGDVEGTPADEAGQVTKTLTFHASSLLVDVRYDFKDGTSALVDVGLAPDLLDLAADGTRHLVPVAATDGDANLRGFANLFSGAFAGVAWNASEPVDDLTPAGTPVSLPGSSNVVLWREYGDARPLAEAVTLRVGDGARFVLAFPPDSGELRATATSEAQASPTDARSLTSAVEGELDRWTNGSESFEDQRVAGAIERVVEAASEASERVAVDRFETYASGFLAASLLEAIDWLVEPPAGSEAYSDDVDLDGFEELVLQNQHLRVVVEPVGAVASLVVTREGVVVVGQSPWLGSSWPFPTHESLDVPARPTTVALGALARFSAAASLATTAAFFDAEISTQLGTDWLLLGNDWYSVPTVGTKDSPVQGKEVRVALASSRGGPTKTFSLSADAPLLKVEYSSGEWTDNWTVVGGLAGPFPGGNPEARELVNVTTTLLGVPLVGLHDPRANATLLAGVTGGAPAAFNESVSWRVSDRTVAYLLAGSGDANALVAGLVEGEPASPAAGWELAALVVSLVGTVVLLVESAYRLGKMPAGAYRAWSRVTFRRKRRKGTVAPVAPRTYEDLARLLETTGRSRREVLKVVRKFAQATLSERVAVLKEARVVNPREVAAFLQLGA
ncbi:MAG: hypothetical protein Kow0069_28020 [Promethearchaeota archaeon]